MKKITSYGEFAVVLTKQCIYKNVVVCPQPKSNEYHLLEYPNGDVERIETKEIISVMHPREFALSYVNTLPTDIQMVIRKRLEEQEELSEVDVERGMCGRVVDLESTINVYGSYFNELVQIRKETFLPGSTAVLLEDINVDLGINGGLKSIPKGTRGQVKFVDDLGTAHIKWETGIDLGALITDLIEVA